LEFRPTRREFVGAAAAVSLLGPGRALARSSAADAPDVFAFRLGGVSGVSPSVTAGRFVLAGVEWSGPEHARIELRARAPDGRWSPWSAASTLGHDADGPAQSDSLFGEPVWVGVADSLQVRASEPIDGVVVHFVGARGVSAAPRAGAVATSAFPLAQPVLDAGPGQPPIIARSAWAGKAPAWAPSYGDVRLGFVHHTDNPNGYAAAEVPAMLFAMYQYHRYVRGWGDIAYNFVIDLFGRIWEARSGGIDQAVIGTQAGGYNIESFGVSVLGTFSYVVPSSAAIDALERLLAWKLSVHGVPTLGEVEVEVNPSDAFYTPFPGGAHIKLPRVAGHRQGCSTDCPGDAFFARLPSIRPRVAKLAPAPAKVTLAAHGVGSTAASYLSLASTPAVAGAPVELSGRLSLLTGTALANAPIEVQQVYDGRTQTLARATSDADGRWSATVTRRHDALVRALHRAKPATASPLVVIEVAPAITLTLESASPLMLEGTVTPGRRKISIEAYRVSGSRRKLVAQRTAQVEHGQFAVRGLKLSRGSYELVATTPAGGGNAAGTSAPVAVTV
jgi:N-acetylmuramoyl-L-alanine amidase